MTECQRSASGLFPRLGQFRAMRRVLSFAIGMVVALASGCAVPTDRQGPNAAGRPQPLANLLLIVVDTLRADHVGSFGGAALTPSMNVLAEGGVRFDRAYAHIPVTGPSHASIFTGVTPAAHGVERNAQALDESFTTIAEVLASRGLRTGAVVSLGVMASKFGFGQGFEQYDDAFDLQWFRPAEEITDSALAMIGGWPREDRFFAFVHYSDPHEPYAPPGLEYPELDVVVDGSKVTTVRVNGLGNRVHLQLAPGRHEIRFEMVNAKEPPSMTFQQLRLVGPKVKLLMARGWRAAAGTPPQNANYSTSMPATLSAVVGGDDATEVPCTLKFFASEKLTTAVARERYRLEVEYADRQIGRLLDSLERAGRLTDTVVVITSDHGEGLGEHGLIGHIHQLYDSLIRVPLIVVAPGVSRRGLVVTAPVRHVDLRPTLFGLLDVEDPTPGVGVDFGACLPGESAPPNVTHLCMTYKPLARENLYGLIIDSRKLIRNEETGEVELYDLEVDPGEIDNLAVERQDLSHEISKLSFTLDSILMKGRGSIAPPPSPEPLGQDDKEMLEALGYVQE